MLPSVLRIIYLFFLLTSWIQVTFISLQQESSKGLSSLNALSSLHSSSSTPSYETFDGTKLGISFQYPSNWIILEAGFDPNILNDFEGVISFDIVDDSPDLEVPGDNGLGHPNLSILSLELPYHNPSLEQYAKVRTSDLEQLFSNYNLHFTENRKSNESIDGFPYWVIDYSFALDDKTQRYGMLAFLIRGEKVYEISYIADTYNEFIEHLEEIGKVLGTAYFIVPANQH